MVSQSPERPAACPCGGAQPSRKPERAPQYTACCGPLIDGGTPAPNAWQLMRSRYTAYVLGATDYLRATWDPATCPADLDGESGTRWLGLDIKRHVEQDSSHALVEFVARFKQGSRAHRLHETSRFSRDEHGIWRYIDGDVSER
ncbi:YchJ family protein [Burkholderia sp. 3C]